MCAGRLDAGVSLSRLMLRDVSCNASGIPLLLEHGTSQWSDWGSHMMLQKAEGGAPFKLTAAELELIKSTLNKLRSAVADILEPLQVPAAILTAWAAFGGYGFRCMLMQRTYRQ